MDRPGVTTARTAEKVLLAIVDFKVKGGWPLHQLADEMGELVTACGGMVVGKVMCPAAPPDAATLIHKGKVAEVAGLVASLGATTVIFSTELKGHHQRNLEESFGGKVLDRTALILDIFARRATSLEGKLQVELAQLQYRLPRLAGGYDALSRQGGGIGTIGPGETKLETDRRRIGQRIDRIRRELAGAARSRQIRSKRREGRDIPLVALVGYTNAGKSTLLNALTGAGQVTRNGLFTTLDSLARQRVLPGRQRVVFSDTVGFMHDLPHDLIEAFKATLEDVRRADFLLHVIDAANPERLHLKASVEEVLHQLGAHTTPTALVLNKIDTLDDEEVLRYMERRFGDVVAVSALQGDGLDALLHRVERQFTADMVEVDVVLPPDRVALVQRAYREGEVIEETWGPKGVRLRARLPVRLSELYMPGGA